MAEKLLRKQGISAPIGDADDGGFLIDRFERTGAPPLGGFGDALAFLIPCFIFIEFKFIGRIFAPEVIVAFAFPFLLGLYGGKLRHRPQSTFFLLASLWLASLIVSDLINDSDFRDYSRGWAKTAVTVIEFTTIFILLSGGRRRLVLFLFGFAAGGFLDYWLTPSLAAAAQPWKFGLADPTMVLTFMIFAVVPFLRRPSVTVFLALGLSVLNLSLGYRSFGGVCFLLAMYMASMGLFGQAKRTTTARGGIRRLMFFLVGAAISGAAVLYGYGFAAGNGLFGEEAQWIYELQGGDPWNIVKYGRTEILVAFSAILDSPLIGFGSWAKNPAYADLYLEYRQFGEGIPEWILETGTIPVHSYFFAGWLEAGILGAVFWGWVLYTVIRSLIDVWWNRDPYAVLIAFLGIELLWDIVFSPFGANARLEFAYRFAILVLFTFSAVSKPRKREHTLRAVAYSP